MVRLKCSGSMHGKHSEGSRNEENFDEQSRRLEKIVFLIALKCFCLSVAFHKKFFEAVNRHTVAVQSSCSLLMSSFSTALFFCSCIDSSTRLGSLLNMQQQDVSRCLFCASVILSEANFPPPFSKKNNKDERVWLHIKSLISKRFKNLRPPAHICASLRKLEKD